MKPTTTAFLKSLIDSRGRASDPIPRKPSYAIPRQPNLPTPSHKTTLCHTTKPLTSTRLYTGSSLIGIATMHKSNPIPVFNTDHAQQISSMRRG